MKFKDRVKYSLKILLLGETSLPAGKFGPVKKVIEYVPSVIYNNRLLEGKSVLITGAANNIGKSIAEEMAEQGADIYFIDIDRENSQKLDNDLKEKQVKVEYFHADIKDQRQIDKLFEELIKQKISIDILVNNAGLKQGERNFVTDDFDLEGWTNTYQSNVFGPVYLTKLITSQMISENRDGNIIFITSMRQFNPGLWPAYTSSKAALGMIVKELALELAPYRIRVNGIAPGWVKTDETGNTLYHKYNILHKSSIEPVYLGRAVVYLSANYFSRYTTGSILQIDSGASLLNYITLDKMTDHLK